MQVIFKRSTAYRGRNGTRTCSGVDVQFFARNSSSPYVYISPFNSLGSTSACWIEIPLEEVCNVCTALQGDILKLVLDYVQKIKQLPGLLGLNSTLDAEIGRRLAS